jgi:hypothetical protein
MVDVDERAMANRVMVNSSWNYEREDCKRGGGRSIDHSCVWRARACCFVIQSLVRKWYMCDCVNCIDARNVITI